MPLIAFIFFFFVASCGAEPASSLRDIPSSIRLYWESFAPTCGGYPSKQDCDDGDMVLFGGLLCASGDERGCRLVRDSQGQDGRFWRSPRRNPGNLGENKSFSRDQASGVLLYLVKTHDRDAAKRWITWINDHRPCLISNPLGGCAVRGPHRFCTDEENQMCTLTPASWAVLARVFAALDLPLTQEMRRYSGLDVEVLKAEARHAPLGYETHLPAVEVLLKQILDTTPDDTAIAARILNERQPLNPFFNYLANGRSSELESKLTTLCPSDSDQRDFEKRQWSWERETAEAAWLESMGWDCLFMANLLGSSRKVSF